MNIRFYIDPETEEPHIYNHSVTEGDVEDVLTRPIEDRPGKKVRAWQPAKHVPAATFGLSMSRTLTLFLYS